MLTERERRAVAVVNELVRLYVYRLPVDVAAICRHCGARLVPASHLEREGMERSAIFAVWGNPDGVAMSSSTHWTIGYNDRAAANRVRFTLAEELMHLLLGHTEDARFRLGVQSYDEAVYSRYESEAKHGASMLLVPPPVYFRCRALYTPASLARACRVSEACLHTAGRWYEENEDELRRLFTAKSIQLDRSALTRIRPLKPVPADGGPAPAAL